MTKTTDALARHWTDALPAFAKPYAQLSRLDRPIGWQLLLIPCLMGLALARTEDGFFWDDAQLAALFFVGAVAMRGAGCTWNDLLDRDIDAKVARTAQRPIPSGRVTTGQAALWLAAQLAIGLVVWLALPGGPFPNTAHWVALASLPLVALYPLMKRITWWPQVWLGLVFSWGVLVAGAALHGELRVEILLLYAGCVAWTIGYDTIYALQDKDDDALIGVRSTARRFGDRWRPWVQGFYFAAIFLWSAAIVSAGAIYPVGGMLGMMLLGGVIVWPLIDSVKDNEPLSALAAFKRNALVGALAILAIAIDPLIRTVLPLI